MKEDNILKKIHVAVRFVEANGYLVPTLHIKFTNSIIYVAKVS